MNFIFNFFKTRKQESKPQIRKMFINECERKLKSSNVKIKTKENALTALHSLQRFLETDDITIESVTPKLISNYEQWLHNQGVSMNTSASYMRSLRALYNKVVGRRNNKYPFKNVTTTTQRTRHRAISLSEIHSIMLFQSERSDLMLARDIFLFSMYCMGMPFIDIVYLKESQIDGDTLTYQRRKTGAEIVVHLEPEAIAIIQRYKQRGSKYLFPIVDDESHENYRRAISRYNKQLLHIERKLHLSSHITSYVPRHTWATHAYTQSGNIQLVADAIGHSSTKITYTYIKPQPARKTSRINKQIIKKIKTSPIPNR